MVATRRSARQRRAGTPSPARPVQVGEAGATPRETRTFSAPDAEPSSGTVVAADAQSEASEPASDVSDPDAEAEELGSPVGLSLAIFEARSPSRAAAPPLRQPAHLPWRPPGPPHHHHRLTLAPALRQVERMPGFRDDPPAYSFTLLGVQLRHVSREVLCGMLVLGIFGSWFMHGYCEERLSRAGEDFPMPLLTWIQFTCVVRHPIPRRASPAECGARLSGPPLPAGGPLRHESGPGAAAEPAGRALPGRGGGGGGGLWWRRRW